MPERIGILVGQEQSFPEAFMAKVNETSGVRAELARIGGTPERFDAQYRVLIDRISHEVPFYRFHLKAASLAGTYVINDPFWWSADEKFFGYSLATRIGVTVPRTVLLPSKAYIPSIDPQRSLRNLEYPLDWEGITRYVGFPAILKPADGGGWKNVSRVNDLAELHRAYDASGTLAMTLQQFIDFDEYVRCICVGKEFILPIQYDPKRRCYVEAENYLTPALEKQVLDGAWALNHALGYDMNSVEFAIKDGVAYAIDFTNPAPDMDVHSILPKHFKMVVEAMARFAVACAKEGRSNHDGFPFRQYLDAPRPRPAGHGEGFAARPAR
jgi:hypothetical protein